MHPEQDRLKDVFLAESPVLDTCCSPRLIMLEPGGNIILVPYQDTNWLGLPGGKVNMAEALKGGNLESTGAFPTLVREIWEECGIDVSKRLRKSAACLGLAEITAIDEQRKQATRILSPIFICTIDDFGGIDDRARVVNIWRSFPGPLFPDAQLGITRLKKVITSEEPLIPVCLNAELPVIYFEMVPQMRLQMGPPNWLLN